MIDRDMDTLTADDLPDLREFVAWHAQQGYYSEAFKLACGQAISAIDQAIQADKNTHDNLKRALDTWVLVGRRELVLHSADDCGRGC